MSNAPVAPPVLKLRLYVAGNGPNSAMARENLTQLCTSELIGPIELDIIDLLEHPHLALADGIVVTPTLLRLTLPALRVIGNLSDRAKVLLMLRAV